VYSLFTERARHVVVLAEQEARQLGHPRVGPEHVALGLAAEGEGLAAWAFESVGIELEPARATLARLVGPVGEPAVASVPFTATVKRVMELANVEVERRGLNFVGTEHVLLGLVDELETDPEAALALGFLAELGVEPARLREAVERFVPSRPRGLSWMVRRSPKLEVRGVPGEGWNAVLSLRAEVPLRRLLARAVMVALDAGQALMEPNDVLHAFSELREGASLLHSAGVIPPPRVRADGSVPEQGFTVIRAGEQLIAALAAAERRAIKGQQDVVTVDDLLLALTTGQASLLTRNGWTVEPIRAALEQHGDDRHGQT
jgi:hypothetical protein